MPYYNIPDNYQKGLFAVDIMLNTEEWDQGILHFTFAQGQLGYNGQPTFSRTYITGQLLEDVPLTLDTPTMDIIAESMQEGNILNPQYSKLMEDALGDHGSENKSVIIKKGTEMCIFGFYAKYKDIEDGAPGSLQDPLAFCIPMTHRKFMSLPYKAKLLHIDWMAVNGSNKDIVDITGDQLVNRFFMERVTGHSERKVLQAGFRIETTNK